MTRANPIQTNFNGGQWGRYLEGRVDIDKYATACKVLSNFIPKIQGPAGRRPGTRFVQAARSSDNIALIDFEPREAQGYILEFGHQYIRFFTNRGLVVVPSADAYNAGTTYGVDDYVTYDSLIYRSKVASNTGNQPDTSTAQWEQTDHLIVTTPYDEADVDDIRWTQSIDVLYLTHPDYPPHKLQRLAADEFVLEEIEFTNGPFLKQNIDKTVTVGASASTGTGITLTASSSLFVAGHVGSLIELESADLSGAAPWEAGKSVSSGNLRRNEGKVYEALTTATTGGSMPIHTDGDASDGAVTWRYVHDFVGVARITAVGSGTSATADVERYIPADVVGTGNNTWRWSFGAWSVAEGFPATVQFFRERLCFAKDDFLDMSVSGDFENFAAREFGETLPDNAIRIRIVADQLPEIRWLSPQDALLVGTTGGEFVVSEVTSQDPLGPDNVKASRQTQYGCANVRPLAIAEATLFVQRENRKLRELAFNFERGENGGFVANDMTVFSDDITESGIVRMAYQAEPNNVIWCVRADGVLAAFTYERNQQVTGWTEHTLGGFCTPCGDNALVESVATIPDPDEGRDDVWFVVRRLIDGATVKYIEYLERDYDPVNMTPSEAVYLDCSLTYDVPLTITGISTANPAVFTSAGHGLANGDGVLISGIRWQKGSTAPDNLINGNRYKVAGVTTDTFTLTTYGGTDIDGTDFPVYTTGGRVRKLVTTISGLDHLEGETIGVLADGANHPDVTVESGAVTLQVPSATVTLGYRYDSDLHTMRIEAGAQKGTAQGRTKRISRCVVRVDSSGTFLYGPNADTLDIGIFRNALDDMDKAVPLTTGDVDVGWNKGFETEGRVFLRQNTGQPLTVIAIMAEVNTQG